MVKLLQMTIILLVTYLTIGILDQTFTTSGNNALNSTATYQSPIINAVLQPSTWTTVGGPAGLADIFFVVFGIGIVAGLATFAVSSITIGPVSISRSDISILAPVAIGLFTMGALPVISIYSFVTRNVGQFTCAVGTACGPAQLAGVLTAGILGVMWLYSVLEWWTWRITSSQ